MPHSNNLALVSDLDTPISHQISRRLALTKVGSRRPVSELLEAVEESDGETTRPHPLEQPTDAHYLVTGYCRSTLAYTENIPEDMKTDIHDLVGKSPSTRDLIASINAPGVPGTHVSSVFQRADKSAFEQSILNARIVIIDFIHSVEDVPFILKVLTDNAHKFVDAPKILIGISTVLTWGRTKPDSDSQEALLSEDEYRRRKPHPNYRVHVALEKEWVKLAKLGCYHAFVVFSGLVYHIGNSPIHSLLRTAWLGQDVPLYGDGDNVQPMIHLEDLCELVVLVVETCPKSIKYVIAMDDGRFTYSDVAKAISQIMGTGKIRQVPKEHAVLDATLNQFDRDSLAMNLRFESSNIKQIGLKWTYEAGFVQNLPKLVDEYRRGRGLTPLKLIVLGPPKTGKSYYAQKLASHYKLAYVDPETVMSNTITRLQQRIANGESPEEEPDGDAVDRAAEKELLDELLEYNKSNGGGYPESHVLSFMRAKLSDMTCQNQGYVLDGYPVTRDEAESLFRKEDSDEDGKLGVDIDALLAPTHIITLDASDEWVCDVCMQQGDVVEDAFKSQLKQYRLQTADDVTVLNYFDEHELHPSFFNVATGALGPVTGVMALLQSQGAPVAEWQGVGTAKYTDITDQLLKLVGKPHNYGPTDDDIVARLKLDAQQADLVAQIAHQDRIKQERDEHDRHLRALADWNAKIEEVKRQEQEVLEAQSLPLRDYLMQHIMPTLSLGLLETCKVRPDDPVDFLAEYLFRHAADAGGFLDTPSPNLMAAKQPGLPLATEFPRSAGTRPTSAKNAVPLPPIGSGTD